MKEYTGAILNERYLIVLALVAFLVLLNQVFVQPPIMEMTTDAPTINVAGRQRMLSQRLAKAALALERASDQAKKERLIEELQAVLQTHRQQVIDQPGYTAGGMHDDATECFGRR